MKIYISGYGSYEEWARLGFPGAASFREDGSRKYKRTHLAKCQVILCDASMVVNGYCLHHSRFYNRLATA